MVADLLRKEEYNNLYNSFKQIFSKKIVVFYDNWCPKCIRFSKTVKSIDFNNNIIFMPVRDEDSFKNYSIDKELAVKKMATYDIKNDVYEYGYNSIYKIIKHIPVLLPLIPLFLILKLTKLGHLLYNELAVKRKIIPLTCNNDCKI